MSTPRTADCLKCTHLSKEPNALRCNLHGFSVLGAVQCTTFRRARQLASGGASPQKDSQP